MSTQVFKRENPTWVVILCVYSCWFTLTVYWNETDFFIRTILMTYTLAWFSSLVHELIHTHPTKNPIVNEALGFLPFNMWIPYRIYKKTHLIHHKNHNLTDPLLDPESNYLSQKHWDNLSNFRKKLVLFNNTLLGRLTIGPFLTIEKLYKTEFHKILLRDFSSLRAWANHIVGLIVVIGYLIYQEIPLIEYILSGVYPSISLSMLRSYAEHRYSKKVSQRTGVIETNLFFRLLFLNNNYHWIHHQCPNMPWYQIERVYEENKAKVLESNGNYLLKGYRVLFALYLWKPWNSVVFLEEGTNHA